MFVVLFSRGIRIPKPLLIESGLGNRVELQVKKGEIKIVAAPAQKTTESGSALLSEKSLSSDWNRPEEDIAWEKLQ